MTSEIGQRVRSAMDSAGINQTELSSQVGIASDKISKSLSGIRNFTSTELARIAKATNSSIEWFISGATQPVPKSAGRVTSAETEVSDWLKLAQEFAAADNSLRRLGFEHELVDLPVFQETSLFVKHGQRLAEWALGRLLEYGHTPWDDNLIGHVESAFGVDVAIVEMPAGCHGFTWQTDTFRLICLARTDNWARQRFTLAHELGHILSGDAHEKVVDENSGEDWSGFFTEKSANAFAGVFLMPSEQVRLEWESASGDDLGAKFDQVAWKFRVSPAALGARLQKLGLIEAAQKQALARLTMLDVATFLDKIDEFDEHARGSSSYRAPQRLTRQYREAYRAGRVSVRPLARLHRMEPDEYLARSDQTPGNREISLSLSEDGQSI